MPAHVGDGHSPTQSDTGFLAKTLTLRMQGPARLPKGAGLFVVRCRMTLQHRQRMTYMNNLLQDPARAWHRDGMTLLKGREGCYLQSPDGLQLRLAAAESPADPRPGASTHDLDR